jgi:hypothetical protein
MIRYMTTDIPIEMIHGEYKVTANWMTEDTIRLDSLEEPVFWIECDINQMTSNLQMVRGRFPEGFDRPCGRILEDGRLELSAPDRQFVCVLTI